MHYFVALTALVTIAWAEPANAQQIKAGVLTCDVSEGMGYIIGSQKLLSCSFAPEGAGRHEDYDGSITKFGLDLGLTRGGFMVWSVFTNTVAGPGFLAGDYVGASGEVTVAAGLECVGRRLKPDCRPAAYIARRANGPKCRYWCCSASSRASAAVMKGRDAAQLPWLLAVANRCEETSRALEPQPKGTRTADITPPSRRSP